MKLFLDVGAHHGETARIALEPEFGFDRVACFDPDPSNWGYLDGLAAEDSRVEPYHFGLWHRTVEAPIYNIRRPGCSVFADKPTDRMQHTATGLFLRASDWCDDHWNDTTVAIAKLNCEGCECDVLDDWMDTGWIGKFHALYVDFDVRKIPSQRHRQRDVLARLARQPRRPFMVGPDDLPPRWSRLDQYRYWLDLVGATA